VVHRQAPEEQTVDLTLTIPDDLATRLRPVEDRLPEILELGLTEWLSSPPGYAGLADVLETVARLPSPEEVVALRPTAQLQARIEFLIDRLRADGLSAEERKEWEHYEYIEHLVRMAKVQALRRQNQG
jgi:hypothetical protein